MPVDAPTEPAPQLLDAAAAIAQARRAAVADRYLSDAFSVEWREMSQLPAIAGPWRDLAARARAANVFYEPAFALPAARVFGSSVGAVLVWSGAMPHKLLGFFPARISARRYGLKLPVMVGWTHAYAPLGTPLVERDAAEPVIAAWLGYLARHSDLPGLVLLPYLPEQGPFADALAAILRRARMPAVAFNRHARALLEADGGRAGYLERALGARRYREVRRTVRRLAELGALMFTVATEPGAVDTTLEDFFALEAGGWKGQAGTAVACDADVRDFVKAAVKTLAEDGQAAIHRILLDGRPVAAAIMLRSGEDAWFWKIAYDESLARFAPGVMLTASVTEQLVEDSTIARADSCATADHPVMNRTWSERLPLCDLLIAVKPQARFARAQRLERLRLGAVAAAKAIRKRFRG